MRPTSSATESGPWRGMPGAHPSKGTRGRGAASLRASPQPAGSCSVEASGSGSAVGKHSTWARARPLTMPSGSSPHGRTRVAGRSSRGRDPLARDMGVRGLADGSAPGHPADTDSVSAGSVSAGSTTSSVACASSRSAHGRWDVGPGNPDAGEDPAQGPPRGVQDGSRSTRQTTPKARPSGQARCQPVPGVSPCPASATGGPSASGADRSEGTRRPSSGRIRSSWDRWWVWSMAPPGQGYGFGDASPHRRRTGNATWCREFASADGPPSTVRGGARVAAHESQDMVQELVGMLASPPAVHDGGLSSFDLR